MKFVPKELEETADASRGKETMPGHMKNVLSIVIIFFVGYLLLGFCADILAASISEEWEMKLFSWSTEETRSEGPGYDRAKRIFDQLLAEEGLRPLNYELFVIESQEPNAFALPGGGVGVTSGLLERVESDIGLATVLGHELGHHHGRHCLKRAGRTLLLAGTVAVLFGTSDTSVVSGAIEIAESSYSQDQELAADEFGLRLVKKAFGTTEGGLEFFEMIEKEHGAEGSIWSNLVASHPPTENRIKHLRAVQRELEQ